MDLFQRKIFHDNLVFSIIVLEFLLGLLAERAVRISEHYDWFLA